MRLNKQIREQILSNAINKAGIRREAEKLCNERAKIAEKILRSKLSVDDEKRLEGLIEEVNSFGGCWVHTNRKSHVVIAHNGMRLKLRYSGAIDSLQKAGITEGRKIIYNFGENEIQCKKDFGAFKNQDAVEALLIRHESLKAQVMAVLNKCNTSNQLIKLWPESEELIPKETVGTGTALMVNTGELNTIIGLPTNK